MERSPKAFRREEDTIQQEKVSKGERAMALKMKVTKSSGNVFADLDLPDADNHHAKARIVLLIGKIIEKSDLTQAQAASKMRIRQPDVSKLLRGNFAGFSLDRLLLLVRLLGSDIEIKIKPARAAKAGKRRQEGRLLMVA
jgi:predicted XRE-type DNA-binding protein